MRFLLDSMFPPQTSEYLKAAGHDMVTPALLGAHNLPDEVLLEIATEQRRVIVTENASDFAQTTTCTVVFIRKSWWPPQTLASSLADALARWADANPDPGPWPHWLEAEFR
ncbi:MAG TPA: DUF5615 family PIN-like protein [Dehalococcoidia bacterium]|nr:DUF5615 family PIN-like protein [Dehalococcoidia bacterium]